MDLKVCRICGGVEQLKNILDQGTEMMDKLLVCTNINIYCEDLLPKLICEQCDRNLDLSYRLRKQSEDTQNRLSFQINRKNGGALQENDNLKHSFEKPFNVSSSERMDQFPSCQQSERSNERFSVGRNIVENVNEILESGEQALILKTDEDYKVASNSQKIEANSIINDNPIIEYVSCNKNDDGILDPQIQNEISEKLNQPTVSSEILIVDGDVEEIINTSDDNCDVNQIIEPINYCSIDLLSSSSGSTSDHCNDFKIDHSGNGLTCNTCHEVFIKKKDYSLHIKQHGDERYQCIQCCKFFPTRFRLKRHEETHNELSSYNCPHCKRSYRALYNLNRHIRSSHLAEKKLDCNICNVSFSRVDVLKRHLQLHSEEKNYSCLLCSRSFKTRDYLYAHNKTHHSENSLLSKTCKRTKPNNTNKKQCGHCGKLFKSSFTYKNHLLIHTSEKPYECECCNKRFRTIAALTTHQRIHDDYRPYQCDLCLQSFKQTAHLKEHKLLHSDSAPQHICTICQAPFIKKSNLKAHMRIHTKEKPFKCADCSAEFSYMHLLQRHASKVHKRSAHKVYIINESDETIEAHDIAKNDSVLDSELYIDTVADGDFDHDVADVVDLIEDDHEIYVSSHEFEVINDEHAIEQLKFDVESCALDSETILDYVEVHSADSIKSQSHDMDMVNDIEDCKNHIIEQKFDIFVSEETKLTSSEYSVNKLAQVIKLEKILPGVESSPGVSEEWGSGWKGTNFIVEIEEAATVSPISSDYISSREDISSTVTINTTNMVTQGPKIIVRTEEILIVGLVLMLWVGAIVLFFNRWGKIRMLEPYQPKFQQQHRASCPLSDIDPIPHQRSSVSRMSMGFVNNVNMPSCQFSAYNPTIYSKGYSAHSRPRQNSVFVGPSPNQFLMPKPPRKTRSAMDLHSMILDETAEQV